MTKGMRKAASFSRWGLLMGVACGLAMLQVANRAARAETISISIVANGFTIDVDTLATGGTSTNYGTVDIVTLNTILAGDGSAYQFSALGGSSNWSGASTGGILSLTGEISIPAGITGSTSLVISETEKGFNTPSGFAGTLLSSSTGNYNDAGPGNSHSADSAFNLPAITTPTYKIASTNTGPDPHTGSASAPIPSFTTPYSLSNFISFSLTPNSSLSPVDSFGVTAKVTAIPEPASVVTMLIGLPLPLVGLAWLRRRRTVEQNS